MAVRRGNPRCNLKGDHRGQHACKRECACCLPLCLLQLGVTSAWKMVYSTVQHVTWLISFLTTAVVVNSEEPVVFVLNGCDEAVVKHLCRDCAFSAGALVC